MTKEKLGSVAASYFPGYTGIMLTGSQTDHTEIYPGSDIDLLIFHPDYGSVYNKKIKQAGYSFDFTLAPLFDIGNTLFNQSNDINGTLLSMIAKGVILSDTAGVLGQVQQYVQSVYDRVSWNTKKEYNRLSLELGRIKKLFKEDLKEHQKVIIAAEFVSTVVAIETIRIHKWRPSVKHRARILYDKNRELTDRLVEIVRSAVGEGLMEKVALFFIHYDKLKEWRMDLPVKTGGSLIAELSFSDFSLQRFAAEVLPLIRQHPNLNAGYRYYYSSLSNYWPTYRYEVCILFEGGDPDKAMELTEELEKIAGAAGIGLLECSVICPKERLVNEAFNSAIEQLNGDLCRWHTDLLAEEDYLQHRWLRALAVCSYLMKLLGLSSSDLMRSNLFLSQRWLLRQSELKQCSSYDSLMEFRVEKYRLLKEGFKKSRKSILDAIESAIPEPVRAAIEGIVACKHLYSSTAPFFNSILGLLDLASPGDVFVYLTLAEEIVQMLNLGQEQKLRCFFYMNEVRGAENLPYLWY